MATFELRLPYVMVCVDEARANDLIGAIDDLGLWSSDVSTNLGDLIPFNRNVCFEHFYFFAFVVDKGNVILEQNLGHFAVVVSTAQKECV